jgi:hypothetical protein
VSFDEKAGHKKLAALPVKAEDDRPPSDLNEARDLLDQAPPVSEPSILC